MGIRHSIFGVASLFLFVICSVYFIKLEAVDKEQDSGILSQVGFEVAGEGDFYRIKVNKGDEDNQYYAFLPSYTDVERIRMSIHGGGKVNIEGTDMADGDYLDKCETNQEYSIVLYSPKNKITEQATIEFLVSANLPAVFITTKSGTMEYINSDKENKESGFITFTSESGKEVYSDKMDKLGGRGNTSWDVPKKSYSN